jgi:hypothetical protein
MKGFAYASTPWSYFSRKNDQLESFVAGSLVASFAWL